MSVSLDRVAVILLASGLSRRYGRRDKLMAKLGGKRLIEHSADVIADLPVMTRVAVCPSEHHDLRDRLAGRFVIAINKKPKHGLGHSIAIGVQVALQFRPDAIVVCMGDMPFIEPWLVVSLVSGLADADIVHAGAAPRVHPPTAFGPACFDQLRELDGDDGAKKIIGQGGFRVASLAAPAPLLLDVDTREELDFAKRQLAVREQYESRPTEPPVPAYMATPPRPLPPEPEPEQPETKPAKRRSIHARIS
jgi:molybdenum cofactor cytidylyltransferase